MNIEFERNGVKKMADKSQTDALKSVGWSVVEVKEVKSKKKAK
jgi:hypothetical protein